MVLAIVLLRTVRSTAPSFRREPRNLFPRLAFVPCSLFRNFLLSALYLSGTSSDFRHSNISVRFSSLTPFPRTAAPIGTCAQFGRRVSASYSCVDSSIASIEQSYRRPNNQTVIRFITTSEGPDCTPGANPTLSYQLIPSFCGSMQKRSVGSSSALAYSYQTCNLTHIVAYGCNDSLCTDCTEQIAYPCTQNPPPPHFHKAHTHFVCSLSPPKSADLRSQ